MDETNEEQGKKLSDLIKKLGGNVAEIGKIKTKEIDIDAIRERMRPSDRIDLEKSVKYQAELKQLEGLLRDAEADERKLISGVASDAELAGNLGRKWSSVYSLERRISEKLDLKLPTAEESFPNLREKVHSFIHQHGKNGRIVLSDLTRLLVKEYGLKENRENAIRRHVRNLTASRDEYVVSVNPYMIWYASAIPVLFVARGAVPLTSDCYIEKKWVNERLTRKGRSVIPIKELYSHVFGSNGERLSYNKFFKIAVKDRSIERYARFLFEVDVGYDSQRKHFETKGHVSFI
jgi:hypothetical protein